MSKIDSNNGFAEGWQKKTVSQELRQVRHEQTEKDRSASKKMVDGLLQAKTGDVQKKTSSTTTSDVAKTVSQPVEKQAAQPQASAPRVEVQQEGAKIQGQEQAFQKAKNDAKNLEQLGTKQVQSHADSRTALTRQAVTTTPQTPQANASRNPQQSVFSLAQAIPLHKQSRQTAENVTRNVDTRKAAPEDQGRVPKGEQNADLQRVATPKNAVTQNAINSAGQMQQTGLRPRDHAKSESKKDGEGERTSKGSGHSKAGGVYTGSKNLDRLLEGGGGLSADAGGDGPEDSEAPIGAALTIINDIPKEDASLTIFNEYDTSEPGIETVLPKYNIWKQHVLKLAGERVSQIAVFNQNLEGKINDMLAVKPISERIIQETENELKLVAAHFIPKNVYGGISG